MRYSWRHYLFSELGVNKIYSFLPRSLKSLFGLTFFALSLELDSWFFHQSSTSRYETSEETRSERQIRETGRIWTSRSQSPALQGIKPQKKPNTKKSRQGIYLLRLFFSSFWLDVAFSSRELELVSAAGGQGPSGRIWLCEPSSTNVFLFWGWDVPAKGQEQSQDCAVVFWRWAFLTRRRQECLVFSACWKWRSPNSSTVQNSYNLWFEFSNYVD